MLKTNSKIVKERVRSYILDIIEDEGTVGSINERFIEEAKHDFRKLGVNGAFQHWLSGLALPIDYIDYEVLQVVKGWLDQTDEEASKYSNYDTWELFLHLITREFGYLLKKQGLELGR